MAKANFKNAYESGYSYAYDLVTSNEDTAIEDIVIYAMAHNPYKSSASRDSFINGVSMRVNQMAAFKNRVMNEVK